MDRASFCSALRVPWAAPSPSPPMEEAATGEGGGRGRAFATQGRNGVRPPSASRGREAVRAALPPFLSFWSISVLKLKKILAYLVLRGWS